MNLIPVQYRALALVIVVIAALSAVSLGAYRLGHSVGHGSASSSCSETTAVLNSKIGALNQALLDANDFNKQLQLSIESLNRANAVAKAQADAAEAARVEAEKLAARLQQQSNSRLEQLRASTQQATTCGPVLQKYWELRN